LPETDGQKPVVLIIIDGLTPSMFESVDTPALRFLADHGDYRRAASTFPSLTPVCLASIATGTHPDRHHIPHLVWWHQTRRGSSSTDRRSPPSGPPASPARCATRSST
jgi:predicted AlkP superfamily pyrophosphatase or phosphodiesterase